MRVESVGAKVSYHDAVASKQNGANFGTVLLATSIQNTNVESNANSDARTMSFNEMMEVEKKAAVALKHGDLIGHQHYTNILNSWKQTIDEGVQQIATVEEIQKATEQEIPKQGLFPEDAPQSLKDFESSLSLKERINLMMAVSVQRLIANAYQDSSGGWKIHRKGEQGYVDLFEQPGFSYTKLAEDMLAYMKFERMYLRADEFKVKEDVLNGFKTAVEGY